MYLGVFGRFLASLLRFSFFLRSGLMTWKEQMRSWSTLSTAPQF